MLDDEHGAPRPQLSEAQLEYDTSPELQRLLEQAAESATVRRTRAR